jgi:hypothetical protein
VPMPLPRRFRLVRGAVKSVPHTSGDIPRPVSAIRS